MRERRRRQFHKQSIKKLGRGTALNDHEKGQTDTLFRENKSHQEIANSIYRSKTDVTNYLNRSRQVRIKRKTGRLRKLTKR